MVFRNVRENITEKILTHDDCGKPPPLKTGRVSPILRLTRHIVTGDRVIGHRSFPIYKISALDMATGDSRSRNIDQRVLLGVVCQRFDGFRVRPKIEADRRGTHCSSRGQQMSPAIFQRRVQGLVRGVHHKFFCRLLPPKLALYLHTTAGHMDRLEELLHFLREQSYSFTGPDEFSAATGRAVFLSFDDNYRSWLNAVELLEKFQVHATFYVNSWPFRDCVSPEEVNAYLEKLRVGSDRETTLSTGELRHIANSGHVIGAHTHTHPVLTSIPQNLAREEIRVNKEELERIVQCQVVHFSYPFGMRRHFNNTLRAYCQSIGFRTIANAIPGMQYAASRPDALHRSVWYLEQPLEFNLANVCVDGRLFEMLTGRSAVGGNAS